MRVFGRGFNAAEHLVAVPARRGDGLGLTGANEGAEHADVISPLHGLETHESAFGRRSCALRSARSFATTRLTIRPSNSDS